MGGLFGGTAKPAIFPSFLRGRYFLLFSVCMYVFMYPFCSVFSFFFLFSSSFFFPPLFYLFIGSVYPGGAATRGSLNPGFGPEFGERRKGGGGCGVSGTE